MCLPAPLRPLNRHQHQPGTTIIREVESSKFLLHNFGFHKPRTGLIHLYMGVGMG